jgi:hypothetical protein
MNDDLFYKWISEMKSKKHIQSKKYMHYNNTFCPLGLLCDISNIGIWEDDFVDKNIKCYKIEGDEAPRAIHFPPRKVLDAISFHKKEERIIISFIAVLNDRGATFEQIADELIIRLNKKLR